MPSLKKRMWSLPLTGSCRQLLPHPSVLESCSVRPRRLLADRNEWISEKDDKSPKIFMLVIPEFSYVLVFSSVIVQSTASLTL